MHEIRLLEEADKILAKKLWEEAFPEDAGVFTSWYFENRFCPKSCYGLFAGDELASMAQVSRDPLWVDGKIFCANLLRGVATAKAQEGKGHASGLLKHILQELLKEGQELSVLKTFIHPFYRKLGYEVYSRRSVRSLKPGHGKEGAVCGQYRTVADIPPALLEQLVSRYRAYLQGRSGYLCRDSRYIRRMLEETLDFGGGLLLTFGAPVEAYCIAYCGAEKLYAEEAVADEEHLQCFAQAAREMGRSFAYLDMDSPGEADAMIRAVNVKKLLEQTVMAGAVEGQAHIEVEDELLPENCGVWQVRVENGVVQAEKTQRQAEARLSSGELAVLCIGGTLSRELPGHITRLWKRAKTGIFEQY